VRRVSIIVTCDCCRAEIAEEIEGSSAMTFTVRGEQREMDICDDCLGGTFLQEARPVTNRKKRKAKEEPVKFACEMCGREFVREGNRDKHQEDCQGR
jgi:hypothetical protein